MTEKKLCPLRMINESPRYETACACIEEKCAWWDEELILDKKFPKCGILTIAKRMPR